MKRYVNLLMAIVATAATMRGDVYLNAERGYVWSEGKEATSTITNIGSDTLYRTVTTGFGNGDYRIAIAIENRRDDGRQYGYTATDGKRQKVRYPGYMLMFSDISGDRLTLSAATTEGGDEEWSRTKDLFVITTPDGTSKELRLPKSYKRGKRNQVILRRQEGRLRLLTGHSETEEIWSAESEFVPSDVALAVAPGGSIDIPMLSAEEEPKPKLKTLSIREIIEAVTDISDRRAGYWTLTARTLEEKSLRMGGDYVIALVPDANGSYTMYYMEGAIVNPSSWQSGMTKATLTPRINGRYDVKWYDSAHQAVTTEVAAIFDGNEVLTIYFPYYEGSTLTFQRLDNYGLPAKTVTTVHDTTDP